MYRLFSLLALAAVLVAGTSAYGLTKKEARDICEMAGATYFEWSCGTHRWCFACIFDDGGEDIICEKVGRRLLTCQLGMVLKSQGTARPSRPPFHREDLKNLKFVQERTRELQVRKPVRKPPVRRLRKPVPGLSISN